MLRWTILSLVVVLGLACAAHADEGAGPRELTVGDIAPAIDIEHWVKGVAMDPRGNFEPITRFETGQVYVIEFWATWCGPCVAGMPHLSELQGKHASDGVTIIGVSDESLPKVVEFLFRKDRRDGELQNDRTHYILTTDPDQSVKRDYFLAAGRTGIPCAFIVGKDGRIEWIGHPGSMDEPLAAVVEETWNREAFKVEFEEERAYQRLMRAAQSRLREAQRAADWPAFVAVLDELLEQRPGDARLLGQKFQTLLTSANDPEAAYAMAEPLLKACWDEANLLNAYAWMIVDDKRVTKRDLDLALKIAVRANEVAEGESAAILDTLARVHHDRGDLVQAIAWQKKAVEQAGSDSMGDSIRAVLEQYEEEAAAAE